MKHGMAHTRLYSIWCGIKGRTCCTTNSDYLSYGGSNKGICDEWKNDFVAFATWAFMNGYKDNLTIDRIDNNKGYSPFNCRWVTQQEQANNKTNNHNITIDGETHTIAEWSRKLDINYSTLRSKIYRQHDLSLL